jgi:hypothetical protein
MADTSMNDFALSPSLALRSGLYFVCFLFLTCVWQVAFSFRCVRVSCETSSSRDGSPLPSVRVGGRPVNVVFEADLFACSSRRHPYPALSLLLTGQPALGSKLRPLRLLCVPSLPFAHVPLSLRICLSV